MTAEPASSVTVYDGRQLVGTVALTPGGYVARPATGGRLGPFATKKAATDALNGAAKDAPR